MTKLFCSSWTNWTPLLNNRCRCLAILALMLWASGTAADPQSKSYSTWQVDSTSLRGSFTIATREVTRLPAAQASAGLEQALLQHLAAAISVEGNGRHCERQPLQNERAQPGYLRVTLGWACEPAAMTHSDLAPLQLRIEALQAAAPSHIHFARFRLANGATFERLYSRHQPVQAVPLTLQATNDAALPEAAQSTFLTYISFGFEHILIGLDHIAFLLTLLLLAQRLRDILFIVTGFTLGHSLTLSLSVLGHVTPDIMVVEALIGFTIAMVAVENVAVERQLNQRAAYLSGLLLLLLAALGTLLDWSAPALSLIGLALFCWCYLMLSDSAPRARQLRPAVTTLFGLVHGFGFASVLQEVGLPQQALLPALFGFNLGVELGQIAIVLLLSGVGLALHRTLRHAWPTLALMANTALCGLGTYWFVQRLYF